jgi:hypothetical protein
VLIPADAIAALARQVINVNARAKSGFTATCGSAKAK